MSKSITEKIDKFLIDDNTSITEVHDIDDAINEGMLDPSDTGIKPGEYNNLSTGIRRIQFRLEKANTPQKYVDAFEVIQQLVSRFPLKSKVIWQTVASMYQIRFGSVGTVGVPSEGTPE